MLVIMSALPVVGSDVGIQNMLIIQKFGGTSVGDVERIKKVAQIVKRERDAGNKVAVVVSAMSGTTNQLVAWCNEVSGFQTPDAFTEYDAVVSSGEQVTSGLLALALKSIGVPAMSFQGWQIGMVTDDLHGRARVESIDASLLEKHINNGEVPVIAGFQGITADGRISTLGRGGSDTSAVAIAAALKADLCDIYTDVDGVYTADPRIVPKARKLNKIAYEEMLEMASLGAKVLHSRSVEMAMKSHVRVQVRSTFSDTVPGTLVVGEEEVLERRLITGITYSRDESRVTLIAVPNKPGMAAAVFGPLADAEVNVDMIIQNISEAGDNTDMTFTVSKADLERCRNMLEEVKDNIGYRKLITDPNVSKVSVVGVGMKSHAGIAQKMFQTLYEKGVNILAISTSEIKISVLINSEYMELALRALHNVYGLDAKEENPRAAA